MKKLLVIFLLTFAIIVGFSGSVAAAPLYHGNSNFVHGLIYKSPGATLSGGNVLAKTGGDVFSNIGSRVNKHTTNVGRHIYYSGNIVY